ncbi:MAG: response regulator [Deltaproteobacteria bacterium]|nr:MAG: response regulator [Deltaproteobacteria bacterium]
MKVKKLLEGKKILIVDDEPDILDSLIELLSSCKIDTASSFEEGRQMLKDQSYDITILDIMGVQGFELLKVANSQGIPALMLTAHALTEESLKRAIEDGAAYFAPKDKMVDIELFVADVFEAVEKKKNPWERLLDRLGGFYDKRFQGCDWREQEDKFLKKKINKFI